MDNHSTAMLEQQRDLVLKEMMRLDLFNVRTFCLIDHKIVYKWNNEEAKELYEKLGELLEFLTAKINEYWERERISQLKWIN